MKRIAVIGAGITGISSVLYLNKLGINPLQIDVFTLDVGGDYLKGGLKYILDTSETRYFIKNILELTYNVVRINGAVFIDGQVHPFPEYFWYEREVGDRVQRDYWVKTRHDIHGFDTRCMNEPWNYKNLLKIVPAIGIKGMMDVMSERMLINSTVTTKQIDSEVLADALNKYDLIIYTIPVFPMFNLLNIKPKKELSSAELTIYRYGLNTNRNIFWEYLYVPDFNYPFHRMNINYNDGLHLDVEINNSNYDETEIREYLKKMMRTLYPDDVRIYNIGVSSNKIKIKGQIKYDLQDWEIAQQIPKNVLMLGRFAEWNKRITWDVVLKKLNANKKLFESFVY